MGRLAGRERAMHCAAATAITRYLQVFEPDPTVSGKAILASRRASAAPKQEVDAVSERNMWVRIAA
jgi:hypothetical protein